MRRVRAVRAIAAAPPANDNAHALVEDYEEAPDEFVTEEAHAALLAEPPLESPLSDHPADQRARLAVALADQDPSFDPPDEEAFDHSGIIDEEPPFDPPHATELNVGGILFESDDLSRTDDAAAVEASRRLPLTPSEEVANALPLLLRPREPADDVLPLPPVAVHTTWDRPESVSVLEAFAASAHVSRAEVSVGRGGIDGATLRFAAHAAPDLLILDTTLRGRDMLDALDRLIAVVGRKAKLIVVGGVNDVWLLRELTARGVSEYLVAPVSKDDLVAASCRLFENTDKARVIAVIGARGGVGASTLALNLAWSIAERQQTTASLLDFDLSFGAAALTLHQEPKTRDDGAVLQRVHTHHTSRLEIMAAPAALDNGAQLAAPVIEAELRRARRSSAYVILDLPHAWTGWVRQVLLDADDVIVVAAPDLASLSSAKAMVDVLKAERPKDFAPVVALSMAGIPKRPQIELREFAAALGAAPVVTLPFDPALFGAAAIKGQMIGEIDARAKPALAIDALAAAITGRDPVYDKKSAQPPAAPQAPEVRQAAEQNSDAPITWEVSPFGELPLELTQKLPAVLESPYITKARAAAQVNREQPKREPKAQDELQRPGRIARMAACIIGIVMLGGVYLIGRNTAPAAAAPQPQAPIALNDTSPAPAPAPPAAPAGDALARYQFALQLFNSGRSEEALEQLRRAAEAGVPMAQYRLAKLYETGDGVEADLSLARQWTERAAGAGNARAMHDLGVYYARGDGARRDEAAAFRWFRQAAEFGVADSQYNLGILYQQGRGVARSESEALFWYLVAGAQGDPQAAQRADALERTLMPMQVEQARARAAAFRPRSLNPAANDAPPPAPAPVADATPSVDEDAPD